MNYLLIVVLLSQSLCGMQNSIISGSYRLVIPFVSAKTPIAGTRKDQLAKIAVQNQHSERRIDRALSGEPVANKLPYASIDTNAVMIEPWGFPIIISRSMIITAACATYLFPFGTLQLDGKNHRLVDISAREYEGESRIASVTKLSFDIDDLVVSPQRGSLLALGKKRNSSELQAHFISLSGDRPDIYQLELPHTTNAIDYGFDASQDNSQDIIIHSGWYEYRFSIR